MNLKVVLLFLITLIILAGVPESFARPQYVTNLSEVYGDGLCGTCHVNASGGGPRNSYGTLFENQPNYATDPSAALRAIGAPTATQTLAPVVTSTPVAAATNLMNNVTDIDETNENETNATEIAYEAGNITSVNTVVQPTSPVQTTIEPTIPVSTTKPSSGFGLVMAIMAVISVIYLFGMRR